MTDPDPQPPVPLRPVHADPEARQAGDPAEERDNPGQSTGATGSAGAVPPPEPTDIDEPIPDPVPYPPGSIGKEDDGRQGQT